MSDEYEESVIAFEAARNEAMDKYFAARQGLSRTPEQERIFEGGFRMAWEARSQHDHAKVREAEAPEKQE